MCNKRISCESRLFIVSLVETLNRILLEVINENERENQRANRCVYVTLK